MRYSVIFDKEGCVEFLESLRMLIEERRKSFMDYHMNHEEIVPKEYFKMLPNVLVLASELEEFGALIEETDDLSAIDIIKAAKDVNITIVAFANANRLRSYDDVSKYIEDMEEGMVLGNFGSQSHYSFMVGRIAPDNTRGVGYISDRGNFRKIQIALYTDEIEGDRLLK